MKGGLWNTGRLLMSLALLPGMFHGTWRAAPVAVEEGVRSGMPVPAASGILLVDMREEKDRVVYETLPVDPNENAREEREKQENAWEMLMNLPGPGYGYPRGIPEPPGDPTRRLPSSRPR